MKWAIYIPGQSVCLVIGVIAWFEIACRLLQSRLSISRFMFFAACIGACQPMSNRYRPADTDPYTTRPAALLLLVPDVCILRSSFRVRDIIVTAL